jgi:hypothetical protein
MIRKFALRLAAVAVVAALSRYTTEPIAAQSSAPAQARSDSAPPKKLGRFGRLRASLLPGTTYAGRLISPLLTEAQEKGVPGLHVQNAIHEFTGPTGDYPALAEGPANQLAAKLRILIRDEAGQQGRVADSIGTTTNAMAAAIMGGATTATPSGLQLPADVAGALRTGRLALNNINWNAGDIALRSALSTELRGVATEMNRAGGPWRIEAAVPQNDGGKETARLRTLLIQNALVNAGLLTVNGGKAVLRPSKFDESATPRVEVVRP